MKKLIQLAFLLAMPAFAQSNLVNIHGNMSEPFQVINDLDVFPLGATHHLFFAPPAASLLTSTFTQQWLPMSGNIVPEFEGNLGLNCGANTTVTLLLTSDRQVCVLGSASTAITFPTPTPGQTLTKIYLTIEESSGGGDAVTWVGLHDAVNVQIDIGPSKFSSLIFEWSISLNTWVVATPYTAAQIAGFNASGAASQTTVNCSTSGSATFSEPFAFSTHKQVDIYFTACLGTASYTYPVSFTHSPSIYGSSDVASTVVTSHSTTAVTVTGTTSTGSLFLEAY